MTQEGDSKRVQLALIRGLLLEGAGTKIGGRKLAGRMKTRVSRELIGVRKSSFRLLLHSHLQFDG